MGFLFVFFFVIFSVLLIILFEYLNKKYNIYFYGLYFKVWKWVGLFIFCYFVNIVLKIMWCCLYDGIYVKCIKFEMDGEIGGGWVGLFLICNKILMFYILIWKGVFI